MIGDQTEKRRHQQSSHVGAGHLDADHSLGPFCPEMRRGGVDDAGIDRRASKPDDDQSGKGNGLSKGKDHNQYSKPDETLPQTDHLHVIQFQGDQTA